MFSAQRLLISLWVLALVLALFPYTSDPTEPIKRLVTDAFVLLLALAGLPLAWKQGLNLRSPVTLAIFLWLVAQLMAAALSDHVLYSLDAMRPFVVLFLLYLFVTQAIRTPDQARRFFTVVVLAALLASLYGFAQYFGYDPFPWAQRDIEEYRGLPATYGNPNYAGHTLILSLVLAAGLVFGGGAWWMILPAGLLLGHLYLTHMRGAWVALAAAVLITIALIIARRLSSKAGVQAAAALAIASVIALGGIAAGLFALQETRGTWAPLDSSLLLRYNSYFSASEMLIDRPLLGFGPGNYALEVPAYWTPYEEQWFATEGRRNTHVHNDYLEAGIDAGIPGLLLYGLVLALGLLRAMQLAASSAPGLRPLGLTLAAAFTAFAIDGAFGFNLRVPVSGGLFFALLGVTEGLALPERRGSRIAAALLPIAAIALAAAGSAMFLAEFYYQRAVGAQFWASRFRDEGRPNDYADALTSADRALVQGARLMPWDPRFSLSLGVNDLNRAAWTEAQAHIGEAAALAPNNVPALVRMAQAALNAALAGSDTLQTAHAYAQRAAALCAPLPEAQEILGRVAFLQAAAATQAGQPAAGLWKEAAARLQAALRLGAANPFPLQKLLAKVYLNLEAWPQLRMALLQATEIHPTDEEVWRLFHSYATEAGDAQTMADALHRAMGQLLAEPTVPTEALAILSLQLASLYQGDLALPDTAAQILSEAIRRSPGDLRLWGALMSTVPAEEREGTIEELMGETAGEQAPVFLRVLQDPAAASPQLLLDSAQQLVRAARVATAERAAQDLLWIAAELFEAASQLTLTNDERAKLYAALGEVHVVAEDYLEAEPMLRAAAPELTGADRAMALSLQAEALAHIGRSGEALALAKQAVALAPNTWRIRWNFARRLAEAGRTAEAQFEYTSLLGTFRIPADFRAMMESELAALEEAP